MYHTPVLNLRWSPAGWKLEITGYGNHLKKGDLENQLSVTGTILNQWISNRLGQK